MDGVTILNTYEEVIGHTGGVNASFFFLLFFGILLLTCGIFVIIWLIADKDGEGAGLLVVIAFLLFLIITGCMTAYKDGGEPITETRYEVVIDDSISYTQFTEKYQVIEQRGEIYVVTEKTGDTN